VLSHSYLGLQSSRLEYTIAEQVELECETLLSCTHTHTRLSNLSTCTPPLHVFLPAVAERKQALDKSTDRNIIAAASYP